MEWISIKDKLPEYNIQVLVYITEENGMYTARYCKANSYYPEDYWVFGYAGWASDGKNITHWTTLPSVPENKE